MSAEVKVKDLRAICARCKKVVPVRRRGKAWRMVARKTFDRRWVNLESPCPVKNIDALPMIRAYVESVASRAQEHAEMAKFLRDEIAKKTAEAEEREADHLNRLKRHEALIQLLEEIAPSPVEPRE